MLRIALFREGALWLAQGLEHDIGVQAENLRDLMLRLAIALEAEAGRLTGLPPAPLYFQALWPASAGGFEPVCPLPTIPGVTIGMKLVA